jgi:amino acid adenylation domain-containing protein
MTNSWIDLPWNNCSLVEVLRWRATNQSDHQGYTFLVDGETEEVHLTYTELDCRARAIGTELQRLHISGERALLLYPPGLEYIAAFFGCLYAGVVAVPAYPPDPARLDRTLPRLQAIVDDARPAVALTTSQILPLAELLAAQAPSLQAVHWIATDTIASDQAAAWHAPLIDQDTLAFIQYTSGSTAAPKGVVLTHGNLLHNSALIHQGFKHTSASQGVIWLPPYHDMGLIGGIIQPLYGGFPVTLMSPIAFLQKPLRWLQAISRTRATTSGGPNFAYDLCVRKITPQQQAGLDLSSWTVAFNGAEPIRQATLERFAATFAPCGFRSTAFYPCYGLAEATLIVTGGDAAAPAVARTLQGPMLERNQAVAADTAQPNSRTLVGCGQSLPAHTIVIVDPHTLSRCAPDQIGEIWVAGPSVAQGYWGRPDETAHTFAARLAQSDDGPFLRTGDLGFMQDAELFVTGRLKDLIIIRGRNHYPQDIELTVEQSHPALRPGCSAVFMIDGADEERLVVVCEIDQPSQPADAEAIAQVIRRAVAEQHDLQVYAVALLKSRQLPKTSSGKIQRYACREAFLADRLEPIAMSFLDIGPADPGPSARADSFIRKALLALPATERQSLLTLYLQEQVAQILRVPASRIEPHQSLSRLGIDSLMAIELQSAIESSLGVPVSLASLLAGPDADQLAQLLLPQLTTPAPAPSVAPLPQQAGAEQPLSYGQRALWFLHHLTPDLPTATIARAVRITGQLDIPALRRAFQALVDRHAALRTTFAAPHGEPVQRVQAHMDVWFQVEDAASWGEAALVQRLAETAQRPFDLEHGPLMRVHLFTTTAQAQILLLTIHHIVVDFWSLVIFIDELNLLYSAAKAGAAAALPPLDFQYADHVRWQADIRTSPEGERLWMYWQRQLAGASPVLNLATDRPRLPARSYRGASRHLTLDTELTNKLKTLGQSHGATLYVLLMAAFQVLLHRYTDQEDILVGSPMAGRSRTEALGCIGYFVNPVALRGNLAGNPSFSAFLAQMTQTVLDALDHQHYPFALLVERLQPARDSSRSELFEVVFTWQKAYLLDEKGLTAFALDEAGARMQLASETIEMIELEQPVAQFDLELTMLEVAGTIKGSLKYNCDLFDDSTIARMLEHFQVLLAGIVAEPEQSISTLPLLTAAEQDQLLVEWNDTRSYPPACLHRLFETHVDNAPEMLALSFDSTEISYRELDARSNQIAHGLIAIGVEPHQPVAILLDRSPVQIAALFGILKAGCAFVCLDPNYPAARLEQIIKEAQPTLLIAESTSMHTHQAFLKQSRHTYGLKIAVTNIRSDQLEQMQLADGFYGSECFDTVTTRVDVITSPQDPAYVVYTSGSTGTPKGIIHSHDSFYQYIAWQSRYFGIQAPKRVAQWAAITFDVAYCEIFGALCFGATLCLPTLGLQYDPLAFAKWLKQEKISLLQVVPSFLRQVLQTVDLQVENGDEHAFKYLDQVLFVGEPLPVDLITTLLRQFPDRPKLFNIYGPTEAVAATCYAINSIDPEQRSVPIGRAVDARQILILDQAKQLRPVGIKGEIYIRSPYLALGYFRRTEETAAAFIQNPLHSAYPDRVYRTGDLGRWLSDGTIAYAGRIDNQVKVRGMRIELEDIESTLLQHESIRECAVLVQSYDETDQRLIAYIVASRSLAPSEPRDFLRRVLPVHMIPSAFVFLDALPRTPNGKLDRRALPRPASQRPSLADGYLAPRTALEAQIAGVWQDLLHVDQIGVNDHFFDLGGHSLLAMQVVSRLRQLCSVELPLRSFLETPTIASLASIIGREQELARADVEQIAQISERVRQLSDDEVKALLQQKRLLAQRKEVSQ